MYYDTPRDNIGSIYEDAHVRRQPARLGDARDASDTIKGATRETFLDYVDELYTPDRMVVGVGGQIGDGLIDRAQELLGDLSRTARCSPSRPRSHRRSGRRSACTTRTPSRRTSSSACRASGHASRPVRPAAPLDRARGGHVVAPLHRGARAARPRLLRLRPRHSYTDAGSLYSQAGVDIKRIDEAIEVIVEQFAGSPTSRCRPEELEKARALAKGRFVLQTEARRG